MSDRESFNEYDDTVPMSETIAALKQQLAAVREDMVAAHRLWRERAEAAEAKAKVYLARIQQLEEEKRK